MASDFILEAEDFNIVLSNLSDKALLDNEISSDICKILKSLNNNVFNTFNSYKLQFYGFSFVVLLTLCVNSIAL